MQPVTVRNLTIGEGIPKICVPIVGNTKEDFKRGRGDTGTSGRSGRVESRLVRVGLQFGTGERGTDRATENIRRDPSVVYLSHFA